MKMKTLILLVVSLVGTQVWAGNVSIPNTFTDGTTASAGEVNENFNAVKAGVNDNDSRINSNVSDITTNANAIAAAVPQAVLKDADEVYVGRVIGMATVSAPYVLTDLSYRTVFLLGQGMIGGRAAPPIRIYYESSGCTGTAYAGGVAVGAVFIPSVISQIAYDGGYILYIPHGTPTVTFDVNSELDTSIPDSIACNTYASPVSSTLYPVYLNDPNITGIQNIAYPARMLIE